MHVWLVKLEEPVPLDDDYRPYRMGMLTDALVNDGHEVTRWCSDRNHTTGKERFGSDHVLSVGAVTFRFLSSGLTYRSPLSPLRFLDNFILSLKFRLHGRRITRPDIIVCSMPTPELAKVSAALATRFAVPLVIDARDYWPEIIEAELRGWKAVLAKPLIMNMKRNLRLACRRADSLVGITDFFRDHLLKYSGRETTEKDAVFPLGYDDGGMLEPEDIAREQQLWLDRGVEFGAHKIIYFAGRLNSTVFNAISPVLEAARDLCLSHPEVLFVLCGSGHYEPHIREQTRDIPNIILPGEMTAKSLRVLRGAAIAALQPIERRVDYQNSFSNKFFEYLSAGLPILSWLDGVSGRKIEDEGCGYIYRSNDELKTYINRLCVDEGKRITMSNNARALFEREFASNVVYRRFSEHIQKICAVRIP